MTEPTEPTDPTAAPYTCPGCGVPTERCSSALGRGDKPQRSIFHSYRCWRLFYTALDDKAIA